MHLPNATQTINLLREMGLTRKQIMSMSDSKTLEIFLPNVPTKKGEGWDCDDGGGCAHIAITKARLACEQGCGKITIHRGVHHKHTYDVVDVLKRMWRNKGTFGKPLIVGGRLITNFATMNERAMGSDIESRPLTSYV